MLKKICKRAICLILCVIMLSSVNVFAATSLKDFEKGTKGTFTGWCWYYPEKGCDNLYPTFYIANRSASNRPDNPDEGLGNLAKETPLQVAQKMKKFMEKRPEGHRVIMPIMAKNFSEPKGVGIGGTFDNWFWWDEGVEIHIEAFKELFYYYKKIGGPDIDVMTLDYEIGCDVWNLEWDKIGGKTLLNDQQLEERYQAIIDDPRYLTDLRPTLEATGYEFYEGADHNELYNYRHNYGETNSEDKRNLYLGILYASERKDAYLNQIFEYVRDNFYPDIISMNYGSSPRLYNPDNPSGEHHYEMFQKEPPVEERKSSYYGNANARFLYGSMSGDEKVPESSSYPFATFKKTPFNGVVKMLMNYEECMAWKDGADYKAHPWIGHYTWDYNTPYASTDYWTELVFHLGLHGVDRFQPFNANNRAQIESWSHCDQKFSRVLYELDEVAGFEGKRTMWEKIMPCDQRYLLSGMTAGGKTVWRITPDLYTPDGKGGHVTMESFLINEAQPTFQIGNQFVKFPEGSFIYESEINESEFGYWVISPEGARPEEYRDESLPAPLESDYVHVDGANLEAYKAKMTSDLTDAEKEAIPLTTKEKYTKKYRNEISAGVSFPDIVGHWAENEMRGLAAKGILEGSDGLMYPEQQVTKAEFLAMLQRTLGIEETELVSEFNDVDENSWFKGVIQTAYTRGYITDTNGYILPNKKLTREEMAVILAKMLPKLAGENEVKYSDEADISPEAKEAVDKVTRASLIGGYPDGTFKPKAVCTRAQAAMIITRILNLSEDERQTKDETLESPTEDVLTEQNTKDEETVEEEIIEEEIFEEIIEEAV